MRDLLTPAKCVLEGVASLVVHAHVYFGLFAAVAMLLQQLHVCITIPADSHKAYGNYFPELSQHLHVVDQRQQRWQFHGGTAGSRGYCLHQPTGSDKWNCYGKTSFEQDPSGVINSMCEISATKRCHAQQVLPKADPVAAAAALESLVEDEVAVAAPPANQEATGAEADEEASGPRRAHADGPRGRGGTRWERNGGGASSFHISQPLSLSRLPIDFERRPALLDCNCLSHQGCATTCWMDWPDKVLFRLCVCV